ncbi:hypothetical protein CEXT_715271 [Caerostris extrusa]|uniref:Uncharacterized protein n=1 Tax=Caerostris extrusa TaxID=172846 RepID=A0AAV4WXK6_CAEEX|nr:hypothetical protein CEXT_715271 [Caerostris extrusa]
MFLVKANLIPLFMKIAQEQGLESCIQYTCISHPSKYGTPFKSLKGGKFCSWPGSANVSPLEVDRQRRKSIMEDTQLVHQITIDSAKMEEVENCSPPEKGNQWVPQNFRTTFISFL